MNSIALISDIHGNNIALDEVLKDIEKKGITDIYCLGDLVGYYCFFNEVIDTLIKRSIPCILGNHDYALINNNGIIERSKTCTNILAWQLKRITEDNLLYLKTLPDYLELDIFGKKTLCVHAGLKDPIDEYLFDVTDEYLNAAAFKYDVLITGHTHLPGYKRFFSGRAWLNPGSVGQPRDGDNRASYMIMNENQEVEFIRVPYDFKKIVNKMTENGFDEYISTPLITGKKIGS